MITLLVRLSASGPFEVLDTTGPLVGHVKDAIIAKFKVLEGIQADQLQLYKLDGSSCTMLDPAQTLHGAGITNSAKLAVATMGQGACQGLTHSEPCYTPCSLML